jgi:hypothetical protein
MLKTKQWFLPLIGLALSGAALAQTIDSPKFYRLDFVVKEVEAGKPVNSRTFSTMLAVQVPGQNPPQATIRAGGRVPVNVGSSNMQFYDLGVSLDIKELRETATEVSLYVTADISTILQDSPGNSPMTRQNKWQGSVIVPAKKPTVVFSSDDMSSKRQLQLEVTATPIK